MEIDGKPNGPTHYTGPIGQQISVKTGLIREPMVQFEKRAGKVPQVDFELNNNDVKLLYQLCHLTQDGPNSQHKKAFDMTPGKVSMSRWMTTGSNILLVYMQTPRPKRNDNEVTKAKFASLTYLVDIIVNIYAPLIFMAKQNYHVTDGSRLYFEAIQLCRSVLEPKEFEVAKKVLSDNGFNAHPEAIITSMMTDPEQDIREEGFNLIKKARKHTAAKERKNNFKFRKFEVLKKHINFECHSYHQLIDFSKLKPNQWTDPPLLKHFTIDDLRDCVYDDKKLKLQDIPNHSQHVERNVALTSKAAAAEIGYQNRHAHIINMAASCAEIPTRATKSSFHDLL